MVAGAVDDTRAEPAPTEQPGARRFPLVVWLLVALQTLLMLCLTVLYPPFQAPDEVAHVDYVLAHRHGEWFDGVGERRLQSGVVKAFDQVPRTQSAAHVGGQAPSLRSARKSFDALGRGSSDSPFPNQMVQHPPLYYGLAAGFSYLLPGFSHHRFDVQVFWLRLLSTLLLAPVPLLIYAAALRATRNTTIALVAVVIPLSIPTYLRVGASVTNDSLLTLLTVAVSGLLVRIAWGDRSGLTTVLLGLAWGGALLTKGFALTLPPAIVLAYLLGADGSLRARMRASWSGIVTAGAIGSALGGWWWVRNLVVYGQVQPNGFANLPAGVREQGFGADRPHGSELDFFGNFFRLLGQRMWGSLGLTDLPSLPHFVTFTAATLLLVSLAGAVLAGWPRLQPHVGLPGWTVGRAVSLVVPTLLTLTGVYLNARSNYLRNHPLSGIQTRYLIPTVLGLAICAALALRVVAGRWRHWLPLAALLAALLFVMGSAYTVLDVEMSSGSPDRVRRLKDALRFVTGWAPFPPAVTAMILSATAGLAVTTAVVLMRGATRGAAGDVTTTLRSTAG